MRKTLLLMIVAFALASCDKFSGKWTQNDYHGGVASWDVDISSIEQMELQQDGDFCGRGFLLSFGRSPLQSIEINGKWETKGDKKLIIHTKKVKRQNGDENEESAVTRDVSQTQSANVLSINDKSMTLQTEKGNIVTFHKE